MDLVDLLAEGKDADPAAAPSLTLLCKPSATGGVGDCPFTQFARMALHARGVAYTVQPTARDAKPAWLLEQHGGSLPCLAPDVASGEGAVVDSGKIADWANACNAGGNGASDDCDCESDLAAAAEGDAGGARLAAAKEACGSFFGALARFIKSKGASASKSESLDPCIAEAVTAAAGEEAAAAAGGGGGGAFVQQQEEEEEEAAAAAPAAAEGGGPEDAAEVALREALCGELDKIEAALAGVGQGGEGAFLGGRKRLGLLDCFLAPKLYVLDVAAKHFKLFTLDAARYPRLSLYRDMVFATAEFKATMYEAEAMLDGWGQARGGTPVRVTREDTSGSNPSSIACF
jgi:hypothetical protein